MPRFLNTYTGEFVWLFDIDANPYAILSHTWRSEQEGGEQTFDDIVKLQALCPITTRNSWKVGPPPPVNEAFFSHPALHSKIKRACEVARKTGFRLIWIDSCCIDKRSSAELSEAINSMYALYRDADVCYVYLADVRSGTDPRAKYSDFRKSRWHKRGWTLQELVAPAYVVFFTRDWTFLGTKTGLASTLEKITRIDAEILLGLKPIKDASVAKRMSWAARRETTREEDRAYSLLGIFGVHMSPIYGEGTNAFLRLQEEIIKHHPDQSIFAWGWNRTLLALDKLADTPPTPWNVCSSCLLAASPDAFEHVGDVSPITGSDFAKRVGLPHGSVAPPLHCIFTPLGVRIAVINIHLTPEMARVLVDEGAARCSDCRKEMALHPLRSVALLRCTDGDGNLIALPLHCPEDDVGAAENVAIGVHVTCGNGWHLPPRVLRLSAAMFNDIEGAPTCVEVSILRHFEAPVKPKALRSHFMTDDWDNPEWRWYDRERKEPSIRLAPSCEEELRSVGFTLTPLESCWPEDAWGSHMSLTTTLNMTNTAQQPPHDDQQRHVPPVHIELGLWPRRSIGGPIGQFAIDRLHKPSAIESAHPVSESPAPTSVPSGHRLDDDSRCTLATADADEERCGRSSPPLNPGNPRARSPRLSSQSPILPVPTESRLTVSDFYGSRWSTPWGGPIRKIIDISCFLSRSRNRSSPRARPRRYNQLVSLLARLRWNILQAVRSSKLPQRP
ncbi:heterokaryon incompatibility protein-domain-containing protein [Lenzites betulinus]|nr:heterokaryon incompatibility protein-domain-containing protein [Lenzites betulinus]